MDASETSEPLSLDTELEDEGDDGFPSYRAKHAPHARRGSFAAEACYAKWVVERRLLHAEALGRLQWLHACVAGAVANAFSILVYTRAAGPCAPTAIVGPFTELDEYVKRLSTCGFRVPQQWPLTPGYALGFTVGWCALDVGWKFAESIRNGALIGAVIASNMFVDDPRIQRSMPSVPDRLAKKWARGVIEELRNLTLPPELEWPKPAHVRRAAAVFQYKLAYEAERALAVSCHDSQDARPRRPDGLYPPDTIVWLGAEHVCNLTVREQEFLKLGLSNPAVDVHTLMRWKKGVLWNTLNYVHTKPVRGRISKFLSRLNEALQSARPKLELSFSLRRTGHWITRVEGEAPKRR
jgi:hypothetical protein